MARGGFDRDVVARIERLIAIAEYKRRQAAPGVKLGQRIADFIGLDTCLEIIKVLYTSTGDPKFRPAPLLVKYVEAGWVGKKAGKGFYDWTGAEPVPTR